MYTTQQTSKINEKPRTDEKQSLKYTEDNH